MEPGGNTLACVLVCMTKEGSKEPNQAAHQGNLPCIFPWKFNNENKTYEGCANPSKWGTAAWCPTKVRNGAYRGGMGTWGYCKMDYEGGNCASPGMCGILYILVILD